MTHSDIASDRLLISTFPSLAPEVAYETRQQNWWEKGEVYHGQLCPKFPMKQLSKGGAVKHSRGNEGNYFSQNDARLPSPQTGANQYARKNRKGEHQGPEERVRKAYEVPTVASHEGGQTEECSNAERCDNRFHAKVVARIS
jgi:hypothetical protein